MKSAFLPNPDPTAFDACAASLRAWARSALIWLIEIYERHVSASSFLDPIIAAAKHQLDRDLRASVTDLRGLICAYAVSRTPLPGRRCLRSRPSALPRGVRRNARRYDVARFVVGNILAGIHSGTLRQRTQRLNFVLDNLEPFIQHAAARFAAMLQAPPREGALVLTFAHAAPLNAAPIFAPASADTS